MKHSKYSLKHQPLQTNTNINADASLNTNSNADNGTDTDIDTNSSYFFIPQAFVPLHLFLCLFALLVTIVGKWVLLGRRKQGAYPWDQSDYCQKWQVLNRRTYNM